MTDTDILKSQCKVLVNLHFFFSEKVHGIYAEFAQILRRIFSFWHRILASPVVCYMDFLQLLCCLAFVGTSEMKTESGQRQQSSRGRIRSAQSD